MQYKLTVEEICMKLKPVFGRKIDEVYLRYAMADSPEERMEIEHILNALYHKHLAELLDKKVLLEPPAKEEMGGEYPLAIVSYAGKKLYPFNLREKDWIRHFCISGMSGSGKTTLAFHIINNFIQKRKPFLIFDWKKSFRPLMLIDGEILNFTVGDENISNFFKININQPPEGIAPKEWINVLCDLITESFFASYGVHKVLLETLDESFKDLGVYNGSKNYPTWNEIKWRLENRLEKAKGRTATWLESALRIAHVLTFGNFGKALNYKGKESTTIESLLDKKIIFELNALGTVEKKFFCEFVLTYIYKLKKSRQSKMNDSFEYAILVDEAHNIFLKDKTHFVKESVTDVIYREMREYGIALICLDQHISKLSDTVTGNSACHVAFQQQLPQDIETISGLMQLKERKNYFSMLPVGSAIVRLSERYNLPFLIEVLQVELRKKEVSDRDLALRMKAVFTGKAIEAGKDPEFRKALIPELNIPSTEIEEEVEKIVEVEEKIEPKTEQKPEIRFEEIKPEIKQERIIEEKPILAVEEKTEKLTPVQEILYEYVEKKLGFGSPLKEIENILDQYSGENYTFVDVSIVINHALKSILQNKIPSSSIDVNTLQELQKRKVYKEERSFPEHNIEENKSENEESGDKQERFLAFLQANPGHELSTVEIYKKLGLSARKGNKIKNELIEKDLIKIKEIKNDKGWKKLIKLTSN